MAFTNIPNGNLQVGAPLRSVDILALRDNIPAVMNGDTGAPKIKAAAFEGQSGAAPVFAARAWVNFNGTGTVAIRASGNVSSITDFGVGHYGVNFSTAMQDENYCGAGMCKIFTGAIGDGNGVLTYSRNIAFVTTTSVRIHSQETSTGSVRDADLVSMCIFR